MLRWLKPKHGERKGKTIMEETSGGERKGKTIMEEMREVAIAKYENLSTGDQKQIKKDFKSMAKDGKKISLKDFTANNGQYRTTNIFNLLDQNNDGFLKLDDFKTLSYIQKSGRPFCCHCGNFIPGMFFTCIRCRSNPEQRDAATFDLCVSCYHGRGRVQCKHGHRGDQFEDNYSILLQLRPDQVQAETRPGKKGKRKRTLKRIGKALNFLMCGAEIGISMFMC